MKKIINSLLSLNKRIIEKIGINKVRIIYAIITILLSSGVCFIGVYKGHDIKFQVDRFKSIYLSLKDGYFPMLIYPNYLNGYGYPLGIFYPDVFLYIPALIALIFDKVPFFRIEMAYNIFIIMINVLVTYTTYKCIKTITKNELFAMVFARIMVISPYFLDDAYTRSALGEHLAFAFLPLVILGLYEITYGNYKKKGIYLTLGLLGIVFSHVLSVLLCAVFVAIFFLFNIKLFLKDRSRLLYLFIYGLFAIGMSLCFTLPLYEMMGKDTYLYDGFLFNISSRAVKVINLFIQLTPEEVFFPSIGTIYLLFYILYIINKGWKNSNKFSRDLIIIGTIFMVMGTDIVPWEYINLFNVVQFPWRFFQLSTVTLTIGFALYYSDRFNNTDDSSIFLLQVKPFLLISVVIFIYTTCLDFDIGFQRNLEYKLGSGEYIPANLGGEFSENKALAKEFTLQRGQIIETNSENIIYSFAKQGYTMTIDYSNNIDNNTYLDLPLIYYYGYQVTEGNITEPANRNDKWLIRVYPNSENGQLIISYGYTTIRKIGITISAVSLLAFTYMVFVNNKNKKQIN